MNPDRTRVVAIIGEAFKGVALGEGIGLWEAHALDNWEDGRAQAAARSRDWFAVHYTHPSSFDELRTRALGITS